MDSNLPGPENSLTADLEKLAKRKKRLKRRLIVYGSIIALVWGAYVFQPVEYDLFRRKLPPKEAVDPDSKKLFSKGTRVMVIVAHPDDSEFYIAGTLLRLRQSGAEVYQLLHTDGDKAYYFWADNSDLREIRREEQRSASAHYGVKELRFLGFPDGRLRRNSETLAATKKAIEDWKPDYILCMDGAYPPRASHQDHRRSGELAEEAARAINWKGWLMRFSSMAPNFVVNVDKVFDRRIESLAIHKSQFFGERLKRIQAHLTDNAIEQASDAGFTYGEAFRAERLK
ncbi:MAG: PIG-L family deacetylase [Fimbriimonadaceae bacterium]